MEPGWRRNPLLDKAGLEQQVAGQGGTAAAQGAQAAKGIARGARQFLDMGQRQRIQGLAGLDGQHVHRPVRQGGRHFARQTLQGLVHALGLLHVGQQGVMEHAGHGVPGNGADAGPASDDRAAVAGKGRALGLPDANHQNFLGAQMQSRRQGRTRTRTEV